MDGDIATTLHYTLQYIEHCTTHWTTYFTTHYSTQNTALHTALHTKHAAPPPHSCCVLGSTTNTVQVIATLGKIPYRKIWNQNCLKWLRNKEKINKKVDFCCLLQKSLLGIVGIIRGRSVAVAVGVSYMWQVTRNMWHMTHDTWHMTPDMRQVTPKYLPLSVLKTVMHSFLVLNSWCKKIKVLVGRYRHGWILLRDLRDYLVDNLDKFRQSSPGNTAKSVKICLICLDSLSTIV